MLDDIETAPAINATAAVVDLIILMALVLSFGGRFRAHAVTAFGSSVFRLERSAVSFDMVSD